MKAVEHKLLLLKWARNWGLDIGCEHYRTRKSD